MFDENDDNALTPSTGQAIVDAAKNQVGSNAYQLYNYHEGIPSGVPKDHQFISNTLDKAGIGFDGDFKAHPTIADWASPTASVPGWSVVSGPAQAGDVMATQQPIASHWYMSPGQSLGISTGNGTTVGILDNNRVGEGNFGYGDGHAPTIRRYDGFNDLSLPPDSNLNPLPPDPRPVLQPDPQTPTPPPITIGNSINAEGGTHQLPSGSISGSFAGSNGREYGATLLGGPPGVTGGALQYQSPEGNQYQLRVQQDQNGNLTGQVGVHIDF